MLVSDFPSIDQLPVTASADDSPVPNTTLRSRVLGKALMKPFPSTLPPQTVLDCILDDNWRDNGILHVLDVVTWKGQDLGDCETPFRYTSNYFFCPGSH